MKIIALVVIITLISCIESLSLAWLKGRVKVSIESAFARRNRSNKSDSSLASTKEAVVAEHSELKSGIAKFYDESSSIWLRVWGENMHHGYYPKDVKIIDHKKAQVDMIDRSIEWAYDGSAINVKSVVDVGCGVGGSSRHIAKKYGATGVGLSLSPFQIEKAKELTASESLTDRLDYVVADALNMPFANESFDLTWSMESGEHMPDKSKFMSELARVTTKNGRIIVVTWCHRELRPGESLTKKEISLLKKINEAYYLPDWVPASIYVKLANELGLSDVRVDDWSEFVEPFWPAVIRSALVPWNFFNLLRSGRTTLRGALATFYMMRGFRKGLIKFVILTAKKI